MLYWETFWRHEYLNHDFHGATRMWWRCEGRAAAARDVVVLQAKPQKPLYAAGSEYQQS